MKAVSPPPEGTTSYIFCLPEQVSGEASQANNLPDGSGVGQAHDSGKPPEATYTAIMRDGAWLIVDRRLLPQIILIPVAAFDRKGRPITCFDSRTDA